MNELENIIPIYDRRNATREFLIALGIHLGSDSLAILFGLIVNLWLFVSIVSSRKVRDKIRNQLICSVALSHLFKILFFLLPQVIQAVSIRRPFIPGLMGRCKFLDYIYTVGLMGSIISDYTVLTISLVFLFQVMEIDSILNVGRKVVNLFPWALGLIGAPSSLRLISSKGYPCLDIDWSRTQSLLVIFTFVPILTSFFVVVAAAVKRRGKARHRAEQLMDSSFDVDSSIAYLAAVLVCVVCETGEIMQFIDSVRSHNWSLIYRAMSVAGQTTRVVILPLVWLLLPDIRKRMKTCWRSCTSCPTIHKQETELVASYHKPLETLELNEIPYHPDVYKMYNTGRRGYF